MNGINGVLLSGVLHGLKKLMHGMFVGIKKCSCFYLKSISAVPSCQGGVSSEAHTAGSLAACGMGARTPQDSVGFGSSATQDVA